jgi:hypothetical protein
MHIHITLISDQIATYWISAGLVIVGYQYANKLTA